MRVVITNREGDVFAIHEIDEHVAEHLLWRTRDPSQEFQEEPPDTEGADADADEILENLRAACHRAIKTAQERGAAPQPGNVP